MTQTRFWPVSRGTVTRGSAGCGQSKRLYVGRNGSLQYESFLRFTLNWAGVGRIVRATLIVYTDDQNGLFPPPTGSDRPKVIVRRLMSEFTEGSNADGVFDSSDFTNPTVTTDHQRSVFMAEAAGFVNRIDITGIVNRWAPPSVRTSDGRAGTARPNYGLALVGTTDAREAWSGWSEDATNSALRPQIELEFELGATVPNAPTSLAPSGAVASVGIFEGNFTDEKATDKLAYSEVQVFDAEHTFSTAGVSDTISHAGHGLINGDQVYFTRLVGGDGLDLFRRYFVVQKTSTTFKVSLTAGGAPVDITTQYTDGGWSKIVWSTRQKASNTESLNARSAVVPTDMSLVVNTTYRWRLRHTDQEAQISAWSSLVSFSVTNTDPTAPTLSPSGSSYASLNGVLFRGTYADVDSDPLLSYQVQLAALPAMADPRWDEADLLLWDTGRVFVSFGDTSWETPYGGKELAAGTYAWRGRHWDARNGLSAWSYATVTLTAEFQPEPGQETTVQIDPQAPWRIVIRGMHSNGKRGPGTVKAILENAKGVGASVMYNSPGELHFTLPVDHPQISVIEPKQTHYAVEFYSGDGWREVFAGLMWDYDATEEGVIFFGIDYLACFDLLTDDRYDPANPDLPSSKGGSKYVDQTIRAVIIDQLDRAIAKPNSPVGFITRGTIATMDEKVTIWSTQQPTLSFVTGLIDSHRQGQGKMTRIRVFKDTSGYKVSIADDPGIVRNNLRLKYGELVQGYRVIPFGDQWSSVTHSVGRTREGLRVLYKTQSAPGIDPAVWGHIAQTQVFDGVSDENDLIRRTKQAAIHAGKLGKRIALGIRNGVIHPLDGYNVCDHLPVDIDHGAVRTANFGSGYWTIYGVAWEASEDGSSGVFPTLFPREDTTAPNPDLIPTRPISEQPEWELGWTPPNPVLARGRKWLDQTDGSVWFRNEDWAAEHAITAAAATNLITDTGHGYVAGDALRFWDLSSTLVGLSPGTPYYVIASGLTANTFKVSLTAGGAEVDITADITSGYTTKWPRYERQTTGLMAAPTANSAPTGLALASAAQLDADGHTIVRLTASLTQPAEAHLRYSVVTITPTAGGTPIQVVIPAGETAAVVDGVAGTAEYSATAQAYDVFGNISAPTSAVTHTTVADTQAPGIPVDVEVTAGVLGFLAAWVGNTARDLAFYEFRYAPDDGTGTAPDTTQWTTARAKTSFVWVGGLTSQLYWFQVRAVDTSGNVVTSAADDTSKQYLEDPEAGMSAALSVTPNLAGSGDIAEGAVGTSHVAVDGLDAGVIRSGNLRVAVSDTTAIDGIQVYDGANLVGFWNENGLYIYSSADPNDYVRLHEGGISVFLDGSEVAALSPAGVNASAITSGALPGGGNIVKNSSFELADFLVPVTVAATWDLQADWNATRVGSDTNVTTGANGLTETAVSY